MVPAYVLWADRNASSTLYAVKRELLNLRRDRLSFLWCKVKVCNGECILRHRTNVHASTTFDTTPDIFGNRTLEDYFCWYGFFVLYGMSSHGNPQPFFLGYYWFLLVSYRPWFFLFSLNLRREYQTITPRANIVMINTPSNSKGMRPWVSPWVRASVPTTTMMVPGSIQSHDQKT